MSEGNGNVLSWDEVAEGVRFAPPQEELRFPAYGLAVTVRGLVDVQDVEDLQRAITLRWQALKTGAPVEAGGGTFSVTADGKEVVRTMTRNQVASCMWAERCVVEPKRPLVWWAKLQARTGGMVDIIAFKAMELSNVLPPSLVEARNELTPTE
jgi:hypothetical protein